MAFTRGLFYPWIDIQNEAWLKTAALYWEHIQTIVPQGLHQPYQSPASRALYEAQVIESFLVDPHMPDVRGLAEDVFNYFKTPEGIQVLNGVGAGPHEYLHPEKMPREIVEFVRLHQAKLPHAVRHRIRAGQRWAEEDNWIPVDARFAGFYMTLLATRLSEQHGLGLLTDTGAMDALATSAKLGAHPARVRPPWSQMRHAGRAPNWDAPQGLAEGLLATVILQGLRIAPETPIERIISFRVKYSDELGRFRTKVGELAESISEDQPIQRMQQHVKDLYLNEVKPATRDLNRALKGNSIKSVADNLLKVTFFSAPVTSLPYVLGVGTPQAVYMGAGISIAAAVALYRVEKQRQLRENPFTYLMSAERVLG